MYARGASFILHETSIVGRHASGILRDQSIAAIELN